MAYLSKKTLPEQEEQQQIGQQNQSAGPISLNQGEGLITNAGNPNQTNKTATNQASSVQPNSSGLFTNLSAYLNKNQEQAKGLAGNVAGQVIEKGNIAQGKIDTGINNFNTQAQQQEVRKDEGFVKGALQNATDFVKSQANVDQFIKQRDAKYTGPNSLQDTEDYNPALQAVTKANDTALATTNTAGRKTLLSNLYQSQQPKVGLLSLDNLLLQNDPNSEKTLKSSRDFVAPLSERLQSANQSSIQRANEVRKMNDETRAFTQGSLNQSRDGQKEDLTKQVSGFNQKLDEDTKKANQFLDFYNRAVDDKEFFDKYGVRKKDYGTDRALFDKFGLQSGQQTFNVFNDDYLNLGQVADVNAVRAQNWKDVATQDDVARYQALAQLASLDPAMYELTKASEIGPAYTLKQGDESLQGRIEKAKEDFLNDAAKRIIGGKYEQVYDQGGAGYVSVGDYLTNPDYYTRAQVIGTGGSGNLNALRDFGVASVGTNTALAPTFLAGGGGGQLTDSLSNLGASLNNDGGFLGGIAAIPVNFLGDVSRGLFGSGGGRDASEQRKDWGYVVGRSVGGGVYGNQTEGMFETANVGQALRAYLDGQGFGNYITEAGQHSAGGSSLRDMAENFGYRSKDGTKKVGYFNPILEAINQNQITDRSGPMTAEEALAARNNQILKG